jgi:hypothetical protein
LLLHPDKWHAVQRDVQVEEFTDEFHRKLAQLFWDHQRDEGEPTLAEFLSLVDEQVKTLVIELTDEVEALPEPEQTLAEAMRHLEESRKRREEAKLVADLRRTTEKSGEHTNSSEDEVALLAKLQEQAKRPDLRRV